jgi:hypothetical protein
LDVAQNRATRQFDCHGRRHSLANRAPPRYIRAQLYNYHYTNGGNANGAWWQRELQGMYFPATTLRDKRWQREVP